MRGDSGSTVIALAGGLLLTLCLIAIAVAVALYGTSSPGDADLQSFYFKAALEVEQSDQFEEDVLDTDVLDTIEGWYDGSGLWRWSFGDSERAEAGAVQVADGETMTYYDRETNVYFRQPLADFNEGRDPELTEGPPLIAGSFLIGWIPYGDPERFFAGWQDAERETLAGEEVAGRQTEVVSLTRGDSTTMFWLDRELPFVLKYEARDPRGLQPLVRVEVIELTINEPVSADVFAFKPPPGAREVEPPGRSVSNSSSSDSGSSVGPSAPEGFFVPGYVPAGFETTREGSSYAGLLGSQATRYVIYLENGDAYLEISQQFRAGGLAESQRVGRIVQVGEATAYLTGDGPMLNLTWASGDIVITVAAIGPDLDEVLRVADSMRP